MRTMTCWARRSPLLTALKYALFILPCNGCHQLAIEDELLDLLFNAFEGNFRNDELSVYLLVTSSVAGGT